MGYSSPDVIRMNMKWTWLNAKLWHPWLPISFSFFLRGVEEFAAETPKYYPCSPLQTIHPKKDLNIPRKTEQAKWNYVASSRICPHHTRSNLILLWQQKSSAKHRPHWVAREAHTKWHPWPKQSSPPFPDCYSFQVDRVEKMPQSVFWFMFATCRKAQIKDSLFPLTEQQRCLGVRLGLIHPIIQSEGFSALKNKLVCP